MNTRQFYIGGAWRDPLEGRDLDVIDPSTEEITATISLGGTADADAAVAAAARAFPTWSVSSKEERLALLRRILEIYEARADEMGETISREMGAPVTMSRASQSGAGAYHMRAFIHDLEAFEFERELRPDTPNDRILLEPIGVCGLITPWNWPMNQIALKVVPALATGCTMVLKPSELSPLSAMLFADVLHEAGVPAGVFNLVNGDGPGVGTRLSGHPDIAMISFTGSSRAGIAISKNAADTLKRVSLELGGKGANIVFADAPDDAVEQGVARCFNNTGQSCNAPTRMLVERSRYAEAVEQAKARAEATAVDLASKEGPSHRSARQSRAVRQGAGVHRARRRGGRRPARGRRRGTAGRHRARVLRAPDRVRRLHERHGNRARGDLRSGALDDAVRHRGGSRRHRQRHRVRADELRADERPREGQPRGPTAALGHGRHERAGALVRLAVRRLQALEGNGRREGGRWGLEEFLETKAVGGWFSEGG